MHLFHLPAHRKIIEHTAWSEQTIPSWHAWSRRVFDSRNLSCLIQWTSSWSQVKENNKGNWMWKIIVSSDVSLTLGLFFLKDNKKDLSTAVSTKEKSLEKYERVKGRWEVFSHVSNRNASVLLKKLCWTHLRKNHSVKGLKKFPYIATFLPWVSQHGMQTGGRALSRKLEESIESDRWYMLITSQKRRSPKPNSGVQ